MNFKRTVRRSKEPSAPFDKRSLALWPRVKLNQLWVHFPKGQLISECIFGVLNFPEKNNEKVVKPKE